MAEEEPQFSEDQVEKATSLLDIIGGLLGVYGLLLLGAGLFASEAAAWRLPTHEPLLPNERLSRARAEAPRSRIGSPSPSAAP